MANELEQRARELVANKLRITRHFKTADEIEADKYPTPEIASSIYFEVITDLVAALQAQQPGAQVECNVEGSWLWCKLMDWCKQQRIAPATQNALFAIAAEAHKLYTAPPRKRR